MDDPALYQNFITNVCGVNIPRVLNELLMFADTFAALLATSEKEFNTFIKTTHASNSARANNTKILIPTRTTISIKAVLFELKDRNRCNAIPTPAMLGALDAAQVNVLRAQRSQALHDMEQESQATLSDPQIPKLTANTYDPFMRAFKNLAARTKAANGTTLDYLLRGVNGNYDAVWASRRLKLKACTHHGGPNFRQDCEALYSLFLEHIGTEGTGSDIVKRFERNKDGFRCYQALDLHYCNEAYLENFATKADKKLSAAVYRGECRIFTMESYYSIMSE